jgi:hypothetical protein
MAHVDVPMSPADAPPPHTDAYMGMAARDNMWRAFGLLVAWGSLLNILILGYAIMTITMGVPWIGAMIGFAVFGIVAGLLMNLGGGWIATVIGLCVLGLVVQGLIALGSALL